MLQLITDHPTAEGTAEQALAALRGGCRWIQIRMKEASDEEVRKAIRLIHPHCLKVGATLIVDDRVELAKLREVHGVHLGKSDMIPEEARHILGPEKIIGATVNSIEDIDRLALDAVDYLGIGPFRFTATKKRLAPILGLEGYRKILECLRKISDIPVVAIGGIRAKDIHAIMETGVTEVAISGEINRADNPEEKTRQILQALKSAQTDADARAVRPYHKTGMT